MCSGSLCVREKWMIQLHVSVYLCISAACPTRTMSFPVSLATSPTTSSPHPTPLFIILFLSSLRSCVSVSLFFDATRDIPPSLLSIFQLLIFLIPLDSSTCHSFFLISLEVSFTMLPHSDMTQKKRKCYSPLCPLLFTRLQSSSVGIT
jgi:hypothetical protein